APPRPSGPPGELAPELVLGPGQPVGDLLLPALELWRNAAAHVHPALGEEVEQAARAGALARRQRRREMPLPRRLPFEPQEDVDVELVIGALGGEKREPQLVGSDVVADRLDDRERRLDPLAGAFEITFVAGEPRLVEEA